ncbi:MAG: metal-dependent transcriptional regulator [Lactobacillaceae bacterium]|jgi:DtxR family Mn-dependent transcriptional regulator|nr:metal-dependent transcriptional regulator [Lactobacillaceae bacterium]
MAESVSKTLYLQTILELSGGNQSTQIPNNQIAEHLHVTPSSVSNMMTKLQDSGEVNVEPYYGVTLTAKGRKTALKLIRSHRLFEVFLGAKLQLSLSETHRNADNLDHDADEKMINALDDFLEHPQYCPHGLLIPDAEFDYHPVHYKKLSELSAGDQFRVNSFIEDIELLQYLELVHFPLHSTWSLQGQLPFEGPLLLEHTVSHEQVQITHHAADFIFIERI